MIGVATIHGNLVLEENVAIDHIIIPEIYLIHEMNLKGVNLFLHHSLEGMDLLIEIVDNFLEDVDTICNVSRTLSVLSSEEDIDKVTKSDAMKTF